MTRIVALGVLVAATAGWGGGDEAPPPSGTGKGEAFTDTLAITADTALVFTVVTGSRLYPEWKEEQSVHLHETFHIGDTEFTGVVRAFVPDFGIQDGRIRNWSREMNNPAAFIHVQNDSGTVDSTWAFLNFPPHFSPNAFFTFRLEKVEGYREYRAATEEK